MSYNEKKTDYNKLKIIKKNQIKKREKFLGFSDFLH